MKTILRYFICILVVATNAFAETAENKMVLRSDDFQNKMMLPTVYTCDGKNISPELNWSNAPSKTASYAIIMSDPDAPHEIFYHWIVYNLPKNTTRLTEDAVIPKGATIGKNHFDKYNYSGPCPPKGSLHHYIFTLYALDSNIEIAKDATPQALLNAIKNHVISQTELVGTYSRWVQ